MIDDAMEFFFLKVLPICFFVLFGIVVLCLLGTITHDHKRDKANLLECADNYRSCMFQKASGCLVQFNQCRGEFYTTTEQWAIVLGDSQTLNAITNENNAQNAAINGALLGGMIGSQIGRVGK